MTLPDEESLQLGDNSPRYATQSEGASARDSVIDACIDVDNEEGTTKLSNHLGRMGAEDTLLWNTHHSPFLSLAMKVEIFNDHHSSFCSIAHNPGANFNHSFPNKEKHNR